MQFSFSECGGCRSCELACSYRNSGEFDISKSAIMVRQRESQGGYTITFRETEQDSILKCDGCLEEDEPACIRYCHAREQLNECIMELRKSMAGGEKS